EPPRSDTPFALCIPRSCELAIALLGVLKAGRSYLPIAHDEPAARRDLIMRQATPELMLVVNETSAIPATYPSTRGIEIGDVLSQIAEPGGLLSALHAVPADQAVYVLFTSGSTGEPKGVVVPNGAVCNRLLWMRDEYGFSPADRILQKTPCTFDVSVWEIFGPLIAGAVCVLADPGAHRDPGRLIQTIVTNRVTICHFVPSMLAEFLRWPDAAKCVSLRLIISSGEPLRPALVR